MRCEVAEEWIQRQLDGDLSLEEEAELNNHLTQCPSCLSEYKQYQQVDLLLGQLPKVTLPHSVLDRIDFSSPMKEEKGLTHILKMFTGKRKWMMGALAALILLSFAVIWEGGPNGSLMSSDTNLAQEEANLESNDTLSAAEGARQDEGEARTNTTEAEQAAISELLEDKEETIALALEEGERVNSPDGTYTAYIGPDGEDIRLDMKVDGSYQPYYISINPESKEWSIIELRWISDKELYYVLYHGETEEQQYWVINVPERKELQLDSPVNDGKDISTNTSSNAKGPGE